MTYTSSDLSVLAYANNFTLWHYTTADTDVTVSNYFDNAAEMLRENDLIIANYDTGDTPSTTFYLVTDITSGVVTVAAYGS